MEKTIIIWPQRIDTDLNKLNKLYNEGWKNKYPPVVIEDCLIYNLYKEDQTQ